MSDAPLPSPTEYNDFLKGIDILGIRMTKGSFESKGPAAPRGGTTVDIAVNSRFVNHEGKFDGIAEFEVRFKSEQGEDTAGTISARYVVTYSTAKPMTDEIWRIFAERNLRMNLWPYLREFIESATVRMAWPRLVLPAMNSARTRRPPEDARESTSGGRSV